MDRTTKILLALIAVALWGLLLNNIVTKVSAEPTETVPLISGSVAQDKDSAAAPPRVVGVSISGTYAVVATDNGYVEAFKVSDRAVTYISRDRVR